MRRRTTRIPKRRLMTIVGLTATLVLGGVVAAPFASASEIPAGSSRGGLAGAWQRWLSYWSAGHGSGGDGSAGNGGWGSGAYPRPSLSGWGGWSGWPTAAPTATPTTTPSGGGSPSGPGSGSGTGNGGGTGGSGSSGGCADVEVVFARGTGEAQGLGVLGTPLVSAIRSALPGVSVTSYAVVYAAEASQASAGPGATDMTRHVTSVAAACPNTRFVLGGYSQGATVTDIAIGITGVGSTAGSAIPAELAPRVAAVVVYGNPLGMMRRTIAAASPTYGPKAKEFCNTGDPVCGAGSNMAAHLTYRTNGTVDEGARFAAGKIKGS